MKLGSVRIVVLGTLILLFAMFLALTGSDDTITWILGLGGFILAVWGCFVEREHKN